MVLRQEEEAGRVQHASEEACTQAKVDKSALWLTNQGQERWSRANRSCLLAAVYQPRRVQRLQPACHSCQTTCSAAAHNHASWPSNRNPEERHAGGGGGCAGGIRGQQPECLSSRFKGTS